MNPNVVNPHHHLQQHQHQQQHYHHHHYNNQHHHGSVNSSVQQQQQHHYPTNPCTGGSANLVGLPTSDDRGSCVINSGGLTGGPMPPSSWLLKNNSNSSSHVHCVNNVGSNSNNCCGPNVNNSHPGGIVPAGSYGAPNNSNSFSSSHSSASSSTSSSPSPSASFYHIENQHNSYVKSRQNPHFNNFYSSTTSPSSSCENQDTSSCYFQQPPQQQQQVQFDLNKSVCDNSGNSSGDSCNNFYNNYYSATFQQQQQQDYHHHNSENYSRFQQQQQHYTHQQHHSSHNYYNSMNRNNHPQPQQPPVQQSHQSAPQYQCQNSQQQPSFRRNSIESFSTEPGELPYNVKYGCNFNTMGNIPFDQQQQQHKSDMNSGSGGGGWTSEDHRSQYFFNNSPTNNNNNRSCNQMNFPQQQQQQSSQQFQFKSCSFDPGPNPSSMDVTVKSDSNAGNGSFKPGSGAVVPGGAVKHRSLSCSMMSSPYQFDDRGHFNSNFMGQSNSQEQHHNSSSNNQQSSVPGDSVGDGGNGSDVQSPSNDLDPPTVPMDGIKIEDINTEDEPEPQDSKSTLNNANLSQPKTESHVESSLLTPELPSVKEEDETDDDFPSSKDLDDSGNGSLSKSEKDLDSLIISTTTSKSPRSIDDVDDEDVDGSNFLLEALDDVSNSSLLGSDPSKLLATAESGLNAISLMADNNNDDDDNESCHSGISSLSTKALSDICSIQVGSHHLISDSSSSSSSTSMNSAAGPQKIAKRSFSEADKDLVINTTAVVGAFRTKITIPEGWKRELITSATQNPTIIYISPSGTKLHSYDEVKNYVCSDGTCKCGLSCPLRLEETFSFDPKVTNNTETERSGGGAPASSRLLCNHKRKIPKSEDSPLISSTRDDLGDCTDHGESAKKRRRTDEAGQAGGSGPRVSLPQESPPITTTSSSGNVSVLFSQQSPDTTTQTPQTDMSPASSVSSEPSIFGGNRSATSTPTPMGTSPTVPKVQVAKSGGKKDSFGFPLPNTVTVSASSPTGSLSTPTVLPPASVTILPLPPTTTSGGSTGGLVKKVPAIAPKILAKKRPSSPCPNVDVRNLPQEQNRPPTLRQLPIAVGGTGAVPSQTLPNSDSVSLFPITSSTPVTTSVDKVLNTGFSISPVLPSSSSSSSSGSGNLLTTTSIAPVFSSAAATILNTVHLSQTPLQSATATLINNGVNIIPLPLQLQRVTSSPIVPASPLPPVPTANTLIHQSLPSSITISMVGGGSQVQLASNSSAAAAAPLVPSVGNEKASGEKNEKSPLQLVQDVVDRFQSSTPAETKDEKPTESAANEVEIIKETSKEEGKTEANGNKLGENPKESAAAAVTTTATTSTTTTIGSDTTVTVVNLPLPASSVGPTSTSASIVTTTQAIVQPMMANSILNSSSVVSVTPTSTLTTATPIILPQQELQTSPFITTSAAPGTQVGGQVRFNPVFQTIQPFFLNQTGAAGGQLIISPQPGSGEQQPFIFDQQQQHHQQQQQHGQQTGTEQPQQLPLLQPATMVIDPSVCGNNALGGPKKKKKRLSKKQQQQQAQMHLQQQLILQQLAQQQAAAQVQQQVAAQHQLPFTILPQSFNLGPQGFLQPMNMNMNMNFFPTPTILTLPNLILNPADGTLFLQPSTPLQTAATGTTTAAAPSTVKLPAGQTTQVIAPKKDNNSSSVTLAADGVTLIQTGPASADVASDDSRQNATPDSSTNDCQLGLNLNPSITISIPPTISIMNATNNPPNNGAAAGGKKGGKNGRSVSSSSGGVKQVFKQKQILPKIDSTTPTVVENSSGS